MSENLHPSQLHSYLKLQNRAKWASWGCLVASILLLSLGASLRGQAKQYKPWVLCASGGVLWVGFGQRKTVKELSQVLGDIDQISRLNFQFWVRERTKATAPMVVNIPALSGDWQPDNLITNIVGAIASKQIRIVANSGAGKSTLAQYLAYMVGGGVRVYEPEGTPDDWQGLFVVGKGENWGAINEAMREDLADLSNQLKTRTTQGDAALAGTDRVYIGEEYPEIRTKCDNADEWLERHARRGRKGRRFLILISQFDKVAAWGLEGKSDLIDCFRCIRLGKIAIKHAQALGDEKLVQWLKADSYGRCMMDDEPCQLPAYELMKAVATGKVLGTLPDTTTRGEGSVEPPQTALNEYEQSILDWGRTHPNEVLKARTLQQNSRLFDSVPPEDIRLMFAAMADRGLGKVDGTGDRLFWVWQQPEE